MKLLAHIREFIKDGTLVSRSNAKAAALLGAPAHFSFYFIFKYVFHLPYENFALRMLAVTLCLCALLKPKLSEKQQQYFPIYWHFMLIFVLPFIFTTNLLMNNFHELWLYWEIFMVFVLIMFVPNWLLFLLDLIIGVLGAIAFYVLSAPQVPLEPHFNIPLWSLVILFSIVAGYMFSFSNWQSMKAEERRKAEEKNLALEALAGGIAHEMRNPLGQISHNLDEILQELLPNRLDHSGDSTQLAELAKTIRQRVAQAQTAVNRGLHIIDMTLENFRGEDLFRHNFSSLSAAAATRKAIDEYGYASEEERHKIMLQGENDFIFRGDENSYLFVLYNLFLNALHVLRERPDGKIEIRFETGSDVNRVIVRDNGPGIPSEILNRIFDPFFTSGKKGGTGLGLAFCRRVMRSFGGDILCSSEFGKFTEFTLTFPVLDRDLIEDFEANLYAEYKSLLSGKRLLLAGNDRENLAIIQRQLAPLGLKIDEAAEGASAMSMIEAKRYDIILSDLNLPVLSASEIAKRLDAQGKEIPVIAFVSDHQPVEAKEGEEPSGIDARISMPPVLSELLQVLKISLETSREALKESLSGKTVLVVDDLDFNRRVIKSMLRKLDVTILEASNGQEALHKLDENRCDLLVMDMKMPVLDGFEASRRLRSSSSINKDIPILGLSGNLDNKALQMAKLSGMNDCLIKPVKMKLFLQKVAAMLKNERPVEV
ncbi:MAG: response regulator [Chlorobiaceae bacterium]|nr:response regulator [Chlorobiaceae bacterium]